MLKIKRLAGFLGLILHSQSDLISLHKHAKQRFHMNVAVYNQKPKLKIFIAINISFQCDLIRTKF